MQIFSKAVIENRIANRLLSSTPEIELDVAFNVPYGEKEDCFSNKGFVQYREHLGSAASILELREELLSRALIPYACQLASMAEIPVNNVLDVLYSVVQPPFSDLSLEVVRDAFTREAYPTMNYGTRHTLLTGQDYDGDYITYLHFDLSAIKELKDQEIRNIHLIIQKELGTAGEIKAYECSTNWYENYIIWNHDMELSESPLFTQDTGTRDSFIVQDITDTILQKIDLGIEGFSIAIKTEGFVIFSARESGAGARIVVTHYDPTWSGYMDKIHLLNKAIIRKTEAKDLRGVAVLTKRLLQVSKAYIDRRENLFSKASLVNMQVPSKANIVRSLYGEGKGFVKGRRDLLSKAFITNASIYGAGEVRNIENILSKAYVNPETDSKSIISKAGIVKGYVESYMTITHISELMAKAWIRSTKVSDVSSMADITNFTQRGRADIKRVEDLYSRSFIYGKQELGSKARILQQEGEDLFGKGEVRNLLDIASKAFLSKTIEKPSTAEITNFIQLGAGLIKEINNFYSKTILIAALDIDSKAVIEEYAQVFNKAKIRQFDQIDMLSSAHIGEYMDFGNKVGIFRTALNGVSYILQPRQWLSNHEGGLLFDRKLPRQWHPGILEDPDSSISVSGK